MHFYPRLAFSTLGKKNRASCNSQVSAWALSHRKHLGATGQRQEAYNGQVSQGVIKCVETGIGCGYFLRQEQRSIDNGKTIWRDLEKKKNKNKRLQEIKTKYVK